MVDSHLGLWLTDGMTKNLNQAVVGDKIIQFGAVRFAGPAEVIAVDRTSYGVASVKARTAGGMCTFYPAAGAMGLKRIVTL